MYPKWLYIFNHWLWVAALGVLLLASVFAGICCLVDWIGGYEVLSYEFWCFLEKFYGWCAPSCVALFAVGTGVCAQYVGEEIHKQRIENEKKERENRKEE